MTWKLACSAKQTWARTNRYRSIVMPHTNKGAVTKVPSNQTLPFLYSQYGHRWGLWWHWPIVMKCKHW